MSQAQPTSRVAGTGSFLPERTVDNHELFQRESIRANFDVERARGSLRDPGAEDLSPVEVFHRWALQVTGIRTRPVVGPEGETTTEEMCAAASREALSAAGMEPGDLDMIVAATVTPADDVPNVACTLAQQLGAPEVPGFTLNAACAGFVYAMASGHSFIRSGQAENVLVVTGDTLTRITDYSDPKTAILFSDGAGAAVLTPSEDGPGVLGRAHLTASYAREHLYLVGQAWLPESREADPPARLRMGGGPRVLRQAILAMAEVADGALATTDRVWDDVDFVIPHQANLRITEGLEKQLPLAHGRVVHNIEDHGNSSASTVSITLDEVLRGEHGPVPEVPLLVLTAVGGGYTSGGLVLQCEAVGGGAS